MLVGGIIFGLAMGFLFAKLIEVAKGNEHLEITLTLLVAHFTFVLAEVISEHLIIYGHEIRLSSIIATLTASMVIGNYGRYKMSPSVEEYMEKFWAILVPGQLPGVYFDGAFVRQFVHQTGCR